MKDLFDQEAIERFRKMTPRQAFETAKDAVYRHGAVSSADFQDVFSELVALGVLTWDEIERFESGEPD